MSTTKYESDRMKLIPFSGIRMVFEQVKVKEAQGEKIIHFEIGRPDFDTPVHIKEAAKKALDNGQVHYTSNFGRQDLLRLIAKKLREKNGVAYNPKDEIIVTVGANEAVFMAMMGLLNPDDEVLIPDPIWLHYFHCAQMAGAVPRLSGVEQLCRAGGDRFGCFFPPPDFNQSSAGIISGGYRSG